MLGNRFGEFDPSGRAFAIRDHRTPMPWCNVVCNGRYGFVVSQNGGGFSWLDDAQHCVISRWEMDLVKDAAGKHLFLSDLDSGKVWSAAPAPCFPEYSGYECVHTLGSTTFTTVFDGIRVRWTMSVAPEDNVEVWDVEVVNESGRDRSLRLSSYFEWCCGVAPDAKREFHRLFFDVRHDARRRAMVATKNMWDIPARHDAEHWNRPWPYQAAHAVGGFNFAREFAVADKQAFLGRYQPSGRPAWMTRGNAAPAVGFGRFGDACAALGGDLSLKAGERALGHFLIAICEQGKDVLELVDRYGERAKATGVSARSTAEWQKRLEGASVESDLPDFDLMMNYWLPYQAIGGRLWGRTGYYQQSGAFGFRDQLQDSQVWLALDPSGTLRQIMLHATRQFSDGSVNHWWHALADFGNHTGCSDDYLWLAYVTGNYVKETGDFAALDRTIRWKDDPTPSTLLEHCHRAIERTFKRTSPRGVPLIGACDWNDGLSAMGVEERGESAWVGMFLCQILADWGEIHDRRGDSTTAQRFRARRHAYADAINSHFWDGAWYRYGTKDSGEWVGASSCREGKIHLNAQTWAILSEIAPPARASSAWASVREHLLSPYGPLLLAPAYTIPDEKLGYVTRYSPGSRENGGVYMHAATWALAAACKRRDASAVSAIWKSISPPARGRDADAYWAEPYVTPGNVDGPLSDLPGRAGWTWYTGSAAWLHRVGFEWVLGIRPTWEGLLVEPVPPRELGRVSVTRTWRGRRVRVRFDSAAFQPGVRPTLLVDAKPLGRHVLRPEDLGSPSGAGGRTIDVEVVWNGSPWPEPGAGLAAAPAERTV